MTTAKNVFIGLKLENFYLARWGELTFGGEEMEIWWWGESTEGRNFPGGGMSKFLAFVVEGLPSSSPVQKILTSGVNI